MTNLRRCAAVLLCIALVGVTGCESAPPTGPAGHGSMDATVTYDNSVKTPPPGAVPPPPMLTRDPQTSVYSYLLWISYAYRVLNSDVATHTFSPYEEVRVNSYVQYSKQQGRAIDQHLQQLQFPRDPVVEDETTATVPAVESWKYRYISTKSGAYQGSWMDVTYDSTYTVVFDKKKSEWRVDKVEATPRGVVK